MENGGFPWGKLIANFLWILGAAVILLDLSYHDYLVYIKKRKWREIVESDAFLRPIHISGILIFMGLAGSLSNPMLAGLMGVGAFFLILLLGKDRKIVHLIRKKIKKRSWPQ
jgi:tellurite resistance protein TehA-like permease